MNRHPQSESDQSSFFGEPVPKPEDQAGPAPITGDATEEENRGMRAPSTGSGGVVGSGAGAGGGGSPEDYDDDPVAGGGTGNMPHPEPAPNHGGDGAKHGSR
jgi:hypothetical protein